MSASIVGMCAAFYAAMAVCVLLLGGTILQAICTTPAICAGVVGSIAVIAAFGFLATAIAISLGMPF
jgi:hypothetical protein